MEKLHTIRESRKNELTLEEQSGIFIIREWIDGSCENSIFLLKDDIKEIINLTK